jgi:hypothetical protein
MRRLMKMEFRASLYFKQLDKSHGFGLLQKLKQKMSRFKKSVQIKITIV